MADFLFTGEDSMIRFDMSEFMEKHTVAKLIGSPPGYVGYNEGGQLTEAVRTKPYCVVLLDEVEKAHPDVFNLLLQILDDGRLTDSRGRVIDFTNSLIVMTTNLGSTVIERESGIEPKKEKEIEGSNLNLIINEDPENNWEPRIEPEKDEIIVKKLNKLVKEELRYFFRPEFLNRIDEIIVFNHLSKHDIWDISAIMIKQLVDRLEGKGLKLVVTDPVRALLVDEGNDPLYGARPLRRTIMHYLEDQLAERCLSSTLKPGSIITVRRKTLENLKSEYKDLHNKDNMSISKVKKVLDNAYISITGSDEQRRLEQVEPLYFGTYEDDLDELYIQYKNPFGLEDWELYTNEIIIDIESSVSDKTEENVDFFEDKYKRVIDLPDDFDIDKEWVKTKSIVDENKKRKEEEEEKNRNKEKDNSNEEKKPSKKQKTRFQYLLNGKFRRAMSRNPHKYRSNRKNSNDINKQKKNNKN